MRIIIVCVLFFSCLQNNLFSQDHNYENLVFEGAGIRGIAYSGVLKQLEKEGVMPGIKKVGGTSAGAIIALLISLGYNSDELDKVISETKFEKFNDGEYIFFGGISRIKRNYGWYLGDTFTKYIEDLIAAKTGDGEITFVELKERGFIDLYVTATCLNKQKLFIFSAETYPGMKVKDAIRMSVSIPFYYEAVFIDSLGNVYDDPVDHDDLDIILDGGITANFPIFMFDSTYVDSLNHEIRIPNYKTLGVRIDSDDQISHDAGGRDLAPMEINDVSDYTAAFYVYVIENLNRNQLTDDDWARTISVSSVGVGPKIKKLSDEEKKSLVNSGERSTEEYLQRN